MEKASSNSILKKLLSKRAAVVALCIIVVTCLTAIFAYQLAPDDTPYANRMIIELGAKPPGFKKQLLFVPKAIKQEGSSKLGNFFNGTPSYYQAVPLNGFYFNNDELVAIHYIDDGIKDTLRYKFSELTRGANINNDAASQKEFIEKRLLHNRTFYLGTDRYGRDILSRLLVGSRVTIGVGLVAVLLSMSIGIVLGCLAGYYRGLVDNVVMWFINILFAIPTILLVFAITLTLGKGFLQVFIAIGLSMWVGAARLIRGQVMVLREMEYINAARVIGLSNTRIIFRHILPNIAGPVMVLVASNFATAILIEAGISFLGFGVQPPQPSWGLMIKEHYNFLMSNRPMLAIIPGIAIMLLVYAFNILGNALRDVLDVRG